jgi:glycerate kinase
VPRLLACPDKLRGSLAASEAAVAIARGAERAGFEAQALPLADGGEGTLEAVLARSGERRTARVSGPLGDPVDADFGLLPDGTGLVEMARASGLSLVGDRNDPLRATTRGTGELMAAAVAAGATRLIVSVGGSATTDGGLGAVEALDWRLPAPTTVACDVTTPFIDAAAVFGPQKGAGPAEVVTLERRLAELAERYRDRCGVDPTPLTRAGAAGGLAGGLAVLGAGLVSGFDVVAALVGLDAALDDARAVITGEGLLDRTSFEGKVVGEVLARAEARGLAAGVVAGEITDEAQQRLAGRPQRSLLALAGSKERAFAEAAALLEQAGRELAAELGA